MSTSWRRVQSALIPKPSSRATGTISCRASALPGGLGVTTRCSDRASAFTTTSCRGTFTQGGLPFVTERAHVQQSGGQSCCRVAACVPGHHGSRRPSTVGLPAAVNPDLQIPYSMQYNAHPRAHPLEYRLPRILHRHQHSPGRLGRTTSTLRFRTLGRLSNKPRPCSRTTRASTTSPTAPGTSITASPEKSSGVSLKGLYSPGLLDVGARYRRPQPRRALGESVRSRSRAALWPSTFRRTG